MHENTKWSFRAFAQLFASFVKRAVLWLFLTTKPAIELGPLPQWLASVISPRNENTVLFSQDIEIYVREN